MNHVDGGVGPITQLYGKGGVPPWQLRQVPLTALQR